MLRASVSLAFALVFLLLLGCAASPPNESNASLCASNDSVCLPPAGNSSGTSALGVQKVEIILMESAGMVV